MKVKDIINNTELDLTTEEILEQITKKDRQVDFVFDTVHKDADGYISWDRENWVCVDGKRFVRSYFLEGKALTEYTGFNKYDLKTEFRPEDAVEILLG